jgi:steroid delta-isomerase-like uncharacterized protein
MKKSFFSTLVLGTVIVACGGRVDEAPAPQVPPAAPAAAPPAPADTSATAAPPVVPPTLTDKILATLKALNDATNAGDAAKVAALYTPTGVVKQPGDADHVGRNAIQASMKDIFVSFPDLKLASRRILVKDAVAIDEWTLTGTNTGPGLGASPSTGKAIGLNGASVFTFDGDGFIQEEHEYADAPTLLSQLGMLKQPARDVVSLPSGAPEVHVAKGTPDEAKNADAAKAVDHAFETKDEKAFAEANADDITWDDMTTLAPINGKQASVEHFRAGAKVFSDMVVGCQVWAFEDWVAQDCTTTAKNTGPLPRGPKTTRPATNKSVTFHSLDVMRMKDAKATHGWSYGNSMEMAAQLGPAPKGGDKSSAAAKKAPPK